MTDHQIESYGDPLPLPGVREHAEGDPVTIRRLPNGRLAVVASTACGNYPTEVDLFDLLAVCRQGPAANRIPGGFVL